MTLIVKYSSKYNKRKVNYDTQINIRIDSKMLNEFKSIVKENYQDKIRELMQMYIDAYKRKINDKK